MRLGSGFRKHEVLIGMKEPKGGYHLGPEQLCVGSQIQEVEEQPAHLGGPIPIHWCMPMKLGWTARWRADQGPQVPGSFVLEVLGEDLCQVIDGDAGVSDQPFRCRLTTLLKAIQLPLLRLYHSVQRSHMLLHRSVQEEESESFRAKKAFTRTNKKIVCSQENHSDTKVKLAAYTSTRVTSSQVKENHI